MSAIAGIVSLNDQAGDRATLERMESLLQPYGRDAQHHLQYGVIGLIHTLLRTTPEDSFDHQPLVHRASGFALLFDGRLDNRDELIEKLGLSAREALILADSTIVLHACLKWDIDAVKHLIGDFALACWSSKKKRLWLARDPLGFRPLFWHRQPNFFAFATLPKALFAIPGVPRALCEERLSDLLSLIPMIGPESFFKDVYRVEPGQLLVLEDDRITTRFYHRFDPKYELHLRSDADYLEAFQDLTGRAIACRLRASTPIASHLSSGFDSSTVTALAASRLSARNTPLVAYTAVPREGFDGPVPRGSHSDEGPAASALARRFANIEHVLIRSGSASPLDNLQSDTENLDRAPLNPCNAIWVDAINADAARRGIKVMLIGQMGNFSISYTGEQYLPTLLRQGRWLRWLHEATALHRAEPGQRWRHLIVSSVGPYVPPFIWERLTKARGREHPFSRYCAINPQFMARIDTPARARRAAWDVSNRPWADGRRMRIAGLQRIDFGEQSASVNAAGLEFRDPTCDLRLIEFCLAVPGHQYLRNGQRRWLLQRLMQDVLPPEILYARTRGLQAADWFENAGESLPRLRDELQRMKENSAIRSYLDLDSMMTAIDTWPTSGWERQETIMTYRLKLLRGIAAGTFIRYVEESNQ
jgi:asparagine synthase (glutamine-hydrolysing)